MIKHEINDLNYLDAVLESVSIDIPNSNDETPIVFASRRNNEPFCRFLVTRNANLNLYDQADDSALLWAVHNNNIKLVRLYVENNADVYHLYRDKKNAIMWAAYKGHYDILVYLLDFLKDPCNVDKNGNNIFDMMTDDSCKHYFVDWLRHNKVCMIKRLFYNKSTMIDNNLITYILSFYFKH